MHFWKDMEIWPLGRVLSEEGQAEYKKHSIIWLES
jgi:hypothetical protein